MNIYEHVNATNFLKQMVGKEHPFMNSFCLFLDVHTLVILLKLPSWFISLFRMPVVLITSIGTTVSFLCPFYVNPDGDWELPFCIEHWNCTCWRRWVGTLNPFFEMTLQKKKSKTHLRLSGLWVFPTQHLHSQITYTWQLFGDSWWHCPDSSCRYWCPMAKQQNWTFWFLACEYQPLSSQQMIRTIHPFKRRWNQLQLPVVKINYSWILGWDFPIPKIPSDQISTPLSNQHII